MRSGQWASAVVSMAVLAGCTSLDRTGPARSLSCRDLNASVAASSARISDTAITRGRIDSFEPPTWLFGVTRARDALRDRASRRIEALREDQAGVLAERERRCRS